MPLYYLAYITSTGQAVNTIFGIVNNERKDFFVFLFQATKELLTVAEPPIKEL